MLKLILLNDTEIEVKDTSTLFDVQIDPLLYQNVWNQLILENMKLVKLTTESGDLIDQKENLVLDSEQSVRINGKVHCHFYLRERTKEELLEEKVELLEAALGVHDAAISDLGEAVSGLAEEGGLA